MTIMQTYIQYVPLYKYTPLNPYEQKKLIPECGDLHMHVEI